MRQLCSIIFLIVFTRCYYGLNNGLTLTPPMGWMSWERFRCNTDCANYPNECISEKLFTDMADRMASDGYMGAGYKYVIIDDCWMQHKRDAAGRLQADPKRFPRGIKWLADYIHSKGLKFGIYADLGTITCAGYPGSEHHLQIDANTFAEWGVDYFKMDGCSINVSTYADGYISMGDYLNKTGRPIVYSCSWPAYEEGHVVPNYKKISEKCNVWRNYDDIEDSWASVRSILNFYGNDKTNFSQFSGPGHFNDPDMLIIGNYGLSAEQERTQMAFWCLMSSPLIMSADLRVISQASSSILTNRHAIAINQDALAIQGRRILKYGYFEIWTKPILPTNSYAFIAFNLYTPMPKRMNIRMHTFGLNHTAGYRVFEVFEDRLLPGTFFPDSLLSVTANPNGVFFGKAIAI